jgi:PhnB protein
VTDPFDRLPSLDLGPVDAEFVDRLRLRIERALIPEITLSEPTHERTTTVQVITPYLCVHDGAAAIDWYRRCFGAAVSNVIEWEGKVGHAELDVAGAVFYLSDEAPGLGVLSPRTKGPGASVSIVMDVAVVDDFVAKAVEGGATLERPVDDSHGRRNGWIMDPFGHRWNVGTPISTPPS